MHDFATVCSAGCWVISWGSTYFRENIFQKIWSYILTLCHLILALSDILVRHKNIKLLISEKSHWSKWPSLIIELFLSSISLLSIFVTGKSRGLLVTCPTGLRTRDRWDFCFWPQTEARFSFPALKPKFSEACFWKQLILVIWIVCSDFGKAISFGELFTLQVIRMMHFSSIKIHI